MDTPRHLDKASLIDIKLSDQVYEVLRQAIISGELEPNARLVERELAERLRISRTPIREAISRLDQEGYVTSLPTRGVVVRSLGAEDVKEIFELRAVLEGYAVRRAATRITREELAELEAIHQAAAECAARDGPEPAREFIMLDVKFHDLLEQAARSSRLERMSGSLRPQVMVYREAALYEQMQRTRSHEAHGRIVEALKSGNPDTVEQAMREHLHQARDAMLERVVPRAAVRDDGDGKDLVTT